MVELMGDNVILSFIVMWYCILAYSMFKEGDTGILGIIAYLVVGIPIFAVILAYVTAIFLTFALAFLTPIYESNKVGALILAIICIAILGYIEIVIGYRLIEYIPILKRTLFLNFLLANIGIAFLFGVSSGLDISNDIVVGHGISGFFQFLFFAFAAWSGAAIGFRWEEENKHIARLDGVHINPGMGDIISLSGVVIGFIFIYKAVMVL